MLRHTHCYSTITYNIIGFNTFDQDMTGVVKIWTFGSIRFLSNWIENQLLFVPGFVRDGIRFDSKELGLGGPCQIVNWFGAAMFLMGRILGRDGPMHPIPDDTNQFQCRFLFFGWEYYIIIIATTLLKENLLAFYILNFSLSSGLFF